MHCSECESAASPVARFCSHCGARLTHTGQPNGVVPVAVAVGDAGSPGNSSAVAGQTLREESRFYNALFEQSAVSTAQLDSRTGRLLRVNRQYSELLGYSREELLELDFQSLTLPEDLPADLDNMERLRAGEISTFQMEKRLVRKDGEVVWVRLTVVPLWAPGTAADYHLAFVEDITGRKQTEVSLRLTQYGLDRSADGFFWIEPSGKIIYVNDAACRLLAYDRSELIGKTVPEIDPNFPEDAWPPHWEELRRRGSFAFESDHRTKDGRPLPVEVTVNHIRHEGREYNFAVMRDITPRKQIEEERRQAEQELRRSEERFSKLFYASPFSIILASYPDGKIVEANEAFLQLFEFERGEVLGRTTQEIDLWQDLLDRRLMVERLRAGVGVRNMEFSFRTKSGASRTVLMSVELVQFDGQTHSLAMSIDITERKRTQAALDKSQERYSLVVRGVNDGLWDWDLHTNEEYHSSRWNEILGYADGELPGTSASFFELIHPADRALVDDALRRNFDRQERYEIEIRMRHKSGSYRWILTRGETVRDASGRPLRMVGSISDITPRKQAEQALRDSEIRYRALFESCADSVFLLDAGGRILAANPAAVRSHGYELDELLAMYIWELNDAEGAHLAADRLRRLRSGEAVHFEVLHRRKDGSTFPVEVVGSPMHIGDKMLILSFDRDISERKLNEEQAALLRDELAHVHRLGTMGEMTAGLAHELNQPLAALHLYASTAQLLNPAENAAEFQELLRQITQQSLRAGQIVQRMRSFVTSPKSRRSTVHVNQLIQEVLALLAVELRHSDAVLELDLADDLPTVLADGIQIQQVLVNLIRNALEALEATPANRRRIIIRSSATAEGIRVSVSDSGGGIDPAIADKLFQPFQTTKTSGHGLGLAICRTLIEAHEGRIGAQPQSDAGTTFFFTIPRQAVGSSMQAME